MADKITFERIIEAGLEDLPALCQTDSPSFEEFYGQVILSFLRADIPSIEKLTLRARIYFDSHPEIQHLEMACLLRLKLVQKKFDQALIAQAEVLAAGKTRWQGELAFIVANSYELHDNHSVSQKWFVRAMRSFEKQSCFRKNLQARLQALICENHLNPQRNLLPDYHDLYRISLKKDRRDIEVATNCLLNISRDFRRGRSFAVALKYCNRALTLAEFQFGSLSHHLSLVHRASLYCDLGRFYEARLDFDFLKNSPYGEIKSSLNEIQVVLAKDKIPILKPIVTSSSRTFKK